MQDKSQAKLELALRQDFRTNLLTFGTKNSLYLCQLVSILFLF